jgi:hypothetical protein
MGNVRIQFILGINIVTQNLIKDRVISQADQQLFTGSDTGSFGTEI